MRVVFSIILAVAFIYLSFSAFENDIYTKWIWLAVAISSIIGAIVEWRKHYIKRYQKY
ncbi:hypothetical protein NDM98_07580 [Shouchella plakortidis]|uniref:Uncharacterized protein n=1 Tax=Alkalicoccobacillus plakortidis TaxID=444060 RepID=A0ABT0XHG7_9BACI|nr:hypothetical protein [Alkalicoccobacillus plakortidis]